MRFNSQLLNTYGESSWKRTTNPCLSFKTPSTLLCLSFTVGFYECEKNTWILIYNTRSLVAHVLAI